jgi:hypothetical protein
MKKRETKKEIENRIRKEILNEQKMYNDYEKRLEKKKSSATFMGIMGSIIGMFFVNFVYPDANIVGIVIIGGVTGGMLGVGIGEHIG